MKKNVIKTYFALSLLVSAVAPSALYPVDTTSHVTQEGLSEKTQAILDTVLNNVYKAIEKAKEMNDEFFSTKNKETLSQHINYIKENLTFIMDHIVIPLEQISLEQPPNTLDHQLLQEVNKIVKRVIDGINKLESTLSSHEKSSWLGRVKETPKLASSLQQLKKELMADFMILEKELELLQKNMCSIYNNALLAGKVGQLRKYVTDLNNAPSPSALTLLAAINHRLNCK